MRKINEIIVHCSATQPTGWFAELDDKEKVAEIDRWHKERGMIRFAYHAFICRSGRVIQGREDEKIGAHCLGYNSHSLGVCLEGGFGCDSDDDFAHHFTPDQADALKSYIDEKRKVYGKLKISGHSDYAPRGCPGFNVREFMGEAKKPSRTVKATKEGIMKGGPVGALGGLSVASIGPAFGGWDANAQIAIVFMVFIIIMAAGYLYISDGGR